MVGTVIDEMNLICPAVEFLAAVRNDLGAPSEAADRASKPAINNFNPPVAEFTFSFPTPNSMSAQNLTNERPMDIMRRIVTPPAASSLAPYHGGTDAVTQGTPDPPEPTLWAFMQRDGFPLFPPPTGSVLELAISLAFPRPADENVLRGWPLMEHLLYESLIKDEKSQFLST